MLARFVGGSLNGLVMEVEEAAKKYGNGQRSEDLSEIRRNGGFVHRPELDCQPMFDEYLSPMWDGGMLRYETQQIYDMMFD